MGWMKKTLVFVALLVGLSWIFRAEIALFGINRMVAMQMEIGPTQEIAWSTGAAAAQDPDPAATQHCADFGG